MNILRNIYLLTGIRNEKDRSWFQYGSMGLMGSVPDNRFRYWLLANSDILLLVAPMVLKRQNTNYELVKYKCKIYLKLLF